MLRDSGAAAVTCLQLLLLAGTAQPRPREWDEDGQQLEAIKHGILRRLGIAGPPPVPNAPDPESISRARRVYEQRVAELRGNRSREWEEREGATRRYRLTAILQRLPDPPQGERDPHRGQEPQRGQRDPHGEQDPNGDWDPHGEQDPDGDQHSQGHQDPQGHRDPPIPQDPPGPFRYLLVVPRTAALRQQLQVLRAQLQLPLHSQRSAQLQVSISTPGGPRAAPRLLHNQDLDPHSHHIDLTSPIRHWAAGHGAALRLELTFTSNISTPLDGSGTRNVVLDVEMKDTMGRGARRRRGLEEECGKSEGRCCRRTMKVSFQEIGWDDWVLAPRSYDMRFCQGSCPHNYRAASIHAQIQARVHALSRAAPAPCCVPAEYDPMVLMHYDAEGRLVSSVFEDMLVTRCHCA